MNVQDLTTLARLSPITEDTSSKLNDEQVISDLTFRDYAYNAERKLMRELMEQVPGED